MMSCLIFVVAALIEFAVVVFISRSATTMDRRNENSLRTSNLRRNKDRMLFGSARLCWEEHENIESVTKFEGQQEPPPTSARKWLFHFAPSINTIDFVTFCVYLFLFVLFNGIYWPVYLKRNAVYD